jgi:ribose transport system permease protein
MTIPTPGKIAGPEEKTGTAEKGGSPDARSSAATVASNFKSSGSRILSQAELGPAETVQPGQGRFAALSAVQRYWLVVPLALLVIFFAIKVPSAFLSTINLQSIAVAAAPILILGVGTTYVLGTGGIDLSIGSVVVLAGVLAQKVYSAHGGTKAGIGVVILGAIVALACGLVVGLINGIMVAKLKIPALVATLAMMGAALGVAQLLTGGQDITNVPNSLTQDIGAKHPLGIPISAYIAVVITIIAGFLLFRSKFGLQVLGIGSDKSVMERRGVPVSRQLIRTYAFAGLLYGVVGVLGLAQYSTTSINGHGSDALNAISAVVIGGTSLFGGIATMFGTVLGVLIPAVLYDGLLIAGMPAYWQNVVIGVVLAAAVYLDQLQRRRRTGSRLWPG